MRPATLPELPGLCRRQSSRFRKGVVILQAAMPAAVLNYMLALQHGRNSREVAGIVVISTLLSFFSLPLLLAWLLP